MFLLTHLPCENWGRGRKVRENESGDGRGSVPLTPLFSLMCGVASLGSF